MKTYAYLCINQLKYKNMITILLVVLAFVINFAIYKTIEESMINDTKTPKWLKYVLVLIPPMSAIFLVLICVLSLFCAMYDTIKNIKNN